jgi:hypothetical protein
MLRNEYAGMGMVAIADGKKSPELFSEEYEKEIATNIRRPRIIDIMRRSQ